MSLGVLWNEVWRIGVSVLAMLALLSLWAAVLPNLTPVPTNFTPSMVQAEIRREERYKKLHRVSVRIDVVFFAWLVLEGFFLVPYLFTHYGLR